MSVPFRVEFKLPTSRLLEEIASVAQELPGGSPEASAAARLLLGCTQSLQRLQEIDYPAARGRAEELTLRATNYLSSVRRRPRGGNHAIGQSEVRELFRVAHQCDEYELFHYWFAEKYHALRGLAAFARRWSRDELLEELSPESWATQHEVLTRWGWNHKHSESHALGHPRRFMCEPADPDTRFYQLDREFDALIDFLHGFRSRTGREFLFRTKREGPDFAVEDRSGDVFGIEFCEAVEKQWGLERSAQAKVLRQLDGSLRALAVEEPDSWEALRKSPSFANWLAQAEGLEGAPGQLVVRGRGPKPAESEAKAAKRICDQIAKKLTKPRPEIRPCILVVNPVLGPGVRFETLLEQVKRALIFNLHSHFDEAWLSTDQVTYQIWP